MPYKHVVWVSFLTSWLNIDKATCTHLMDSGDALSVFREITIRQSERWSFRFRNISVRSTCLSWKKYVCFNVCVSLMTAINWRSNSVSKDHLLIKDHLHTNLEASEAKCSWVTCCTRCGKPLHQQIERHFDFHVQNKMSLLRRGEGQGALQYYVFYLFCQWNCRRVAYPLLTNPHCLYGALACCKMQKFKF